MRSNLTKRVGCLEIRSLQSSDIEWCATDHTIKRTGRAREKKQASDIAFILGKPAGGLCKDCVKEWIIVWESITEYEMTKEKTRK